MSATCVVVGVDGSREAREAAILGRRIAVAAGGDVHLVVAATQTLAEVVAVRARLDVDRLHQQLLERARRTAESGLVGAFAEGDPPPELIARFGRAEHVLAEYGRTVGADLFVVGGRSQEGLGSWVGRGTAHHLLHVAGHPVLVTKPGDPSIDRVLVAVDVSFAAEPTIALAVELADLLGADLEALHVVSDPALPPGLDFRLDNDAMAVAAETEAERMLWPLLPERARRSCQRGDVVTTVTNVAEAVPHTLLVVGAQGSGWSHHLLLGSVTEKLLSELPCSLAITPVKPPSSSPTP